MSKIGAEVCQWPLCEQGNNNYNTNREIWLYISKYVYTSTHIVHTCTYIYICRYIF